MPIEEQCPTNEPKVFKCPECEAEIDTVKYSCYTSGKEWGTCYINDRGEFEDHECDDSETNDCDDYEYECPECGHDLCESDFRDMTPKPPTAKKPELNEDGKPITNVMTEFLEQVILKEETYYHQHIFDDDENSEFFHCKVCGTLNERGKEETAPECTKCGAVLIKEVCNQVNLN